MFRYRSAGRVPALALLLGLSAKLVLRHATMNVHSKEEF
jgi:hypothetical protein